MARNRAQIIIETDQETRQKIKIAAAVAGKTMKDWIIEACAEKLTREEEKAK